MNKFNQFNYQDKIYDLSHLNAFYYEFSQLENSSKTEKKYRCLIEFGTHCFTKSPIL